MMTLMHLFDTASFWKAIAFVLVAAVTFMPLYLFIMRRLNARAAAIQQKISDALRAQKEAQKALNAADEQDSHKAQERAQTLAKTRRSVASLKKEAQTHLHTRQRTKEREILDRMKMIKENSLTDLKAQVLAFTVQAGERVMQSDTQFAKKAVFFDTALDELKNVLNESKEVEKLFAYDKVALIKKG